MHSPTEPSASKTPTAIGTARPLAAALERAMQRGQWDHADRLARDASRVMHESLRLTEQVARLRLAQGKPEAALAIVDGARSQPASLRFLRVITLLELGRVAEAHLALAEWSRQPGAPLEARRLFALLEHEQGRRDDALAALLRNLGQIEDPQTIALLLLDSAATDGVNRASQWAQRLLSAARWSPLPFDPAALLATLGIDAARIELLPPSEDDMATLAMELTLAEHAIPALVRNHERAARRDNAQHDNIDLLSRAIAHALPNLVHQSSACESVARLERIAGRLEDALVWAQQGLELNPMSASLALLVHELEPQTPQADAGTAIPRRKAA